MSEMKQKIQSDLAASMKAKDQVRTGTLRMLLSAIMYEERSGEKHDATDEQILAVIAREIKKRKESAEIYAGNNRPELAEKEEAEAQILSEYQPQQLSDEELEALVGEVIAEVAGDSPSMKDMGKVMKAAQSKAQGRADGKRLSTVVKAHLMG